MESPPLTPEQERAAALLLAGHSVPEAAGVLGRDRTAVWRWTKEPAFAAWLSEQRAARRQAVAAELDAATLEAVRVLRELATDPGQQGAVRVRAAVELLDRSGVTAATVLEVRQAPRAVSLEGLTTGECDLLAELALAR